MIAEDTAGNTRQLPKWNFIQLVTLATKTLCTSDQSLLRADQNMIPTGRRGYGHDTHNVNNALQKYHETEGSLPGCLQNVIYVLET